MPRPRATFGGEGGLAPLQRRDFVRIARARLDEIERDRREGKLEPASLRQDALAVVGKILNGPKLDRTAVMASKLVLERTDPIVEPDKTPGLVVTNVTLVFESPASPSGHALPGVRIALEETHGG